MNPAAKSDNRKHHFIGHFQANLSKSVASLII